MGDAGSGRKGPKGGGGDLSHVFRLLGEAISSWDLNLNEVPPNIFDLPNAPAWSATKLAGAPGEGPWEDVTQGPWREEAMLRVGPEAVRSRIGAMQEAGDRMLKAEDDRHARRLGAISSASASLARRPPWFANRTARALAAAELEQEALRAGTRAATEARLAEGDAFLRMLRAEVDKACGLLRFHCREVAAHAEEQNRDQDVGAAWEAFFLRVGSRRVGLRAQGWRHCSSRQEKRRMPRILYPWGPAHSMRRPRQLEEDFQARLGF